LLNLAYLFDPRPGPLPIPDLQLLIALLAALAIWVTASIRWARAKQSSDLTRWLALAQIPLALLTTFLAVARVLNVPYLSMRILLYGAAFAFGAAWSAYLVHWGHRTGFFKRQLSLLTFSWPEMKPSTPTDASVVLLGGHLIGLAFLSVHLGRPWLWLAALVLLLWSPQLLMALRSRSWAVHLEALTPLFFAYSAAAGRRICAKLLNQPLPLYDGFAYPEPLSSIFNVEAILLASIVYVLLCQGYLLALRRERTYRFTAYVGVALAIVALAWGGVVYLKHRTHGVTANDPYAYAQMAVDISERGTPTHQFPLFPRVSQLGISWWPVVHYGYQVRVPPLGGDGTTATDWPPGWPAILAVGYAVLGEQGLYLLNPLVGVLCIAAVMALVAELLHGRPWPERLLGGAFAGFCLATSYEQVDRLVVPMADASTQLFTVLTLFLILAGLRQRSWLYAGLAGLSFGWAYLIRHTQLVLALCVPVALVYLRDRTFTSKARWSLVAVFGVTAFVVALPDLLYHQVVFGHFLRPESTELELFGAGHISSTALEMWRRGLSANEFGYLVPLLAYGAYRMFREAKGPFLIFLTAFVGIVAVHLPYAALRLRDLLSAFPILVAWAGFGVADLWGRVAPARRPASSPGYALGTSIVLAVLLLPILRTWPILGRPWGTYMASFGYVTPEQRRGFDEVAQHTVEPCVVGSTLNGGPIDLYAGRQAFRPAFWSSDEFDTFVEQMFKEGTHVYLVDDGDAMAATLEHSRAFYEVSPIAQLTIPLFGDPQNISSTLYQVQPAKGSPHE
jgi:hypothetical protein